MPVVAATQHAPFPPAGSVFNAAVAEALSALDTVSTNALGYDGTIVVSGPNLVNGHGTIIQLRGFDIEGTVAASIQNVGQGGVGDITGGTYYGDQVFGPNLTYIGQWKPNCVRLGLNESTVLGGTWYDSLGGSVNADPYGVFATQIVQKVAQYNAAGIYVILCIAWTNPGRSVSTGQGYLGNQDNTIQAWQKLAGLLGYPNGTGLKRNGGTADDRGTIFELFNEPQPYGDSPTSWGFNMNGGLVSFGYNANTVAGGANKVITPYFCGTPTGSFIPGEAFTSTSPSGIVGNVYFTYLNTTTGFTASGARQIHLYNVTGGTPIAGTVIHGTTSGATVTLQTFAGNISGWYAAGHADLLKAIRAAGAGNVCLLSGLDYNKDLGQWATYAPTDSTAPTAWTGPSWSAQIGASWHPYPASSYITVAAINAGGSGYNGWSGTTTSAGTTTTLNDTGQAWVPSGLIGCTVVYTVSTTTYQAVVTANTATQLTFAAQGAAPTNALAYVVGDTILLAMDESGGIHSGNCYWQAKLVVTGVTSGAITSAVPIGYTGGTPGVAGGNAGQYLGHLQAGQILGGVFCDADLPANPIAQYSTTGAGTGASFNVTFQSFNNNPGTGFWPEQSTWPQVVTLNQTFAAYNNTGCPIVITETGDHTGTGIVGAPWIKPLSSWCDTNGISFLPFTYTPVNGYYNPAGQDFSLQQPSHVPTPGYGTFVFNWMSTHP